MRGGGKRLNQVSAKIMDDILTTSSRSRWFPDQLWPSSAGSRYAAYALVFCNELTRAEIGTFMHPSEGEMVCESTNPKIPYFNAPIYLENKVRDNQAAQEHG